MRHAPPEPTDAWFEEQRRRLTAIARNLLGDHAEAEDVVQEAWLRLRRSSTVGIENPAAWLTTVVSRLSLDVLRSARRRWEAPLIVEAWSDAPMDAPTPEEDAVRADELSVALLVVLETLSPAERLAFVLHDVFGLSFTEIARVLDRSEAAVRQLASRARTRVCSGPERVTTSRADARVVDAWLAAAQGGDFTSLLELLDEGAVLHADYGAHSDTIRGAREIAQQATLSARLAANSRRVRIDGRPAVAAVIAGRVVSIMVFDISDGRIASLDVLADPERLARLAGLSTAVGLDGAD